ncbi:sensor domain-containing diguanylate cyclase [Altererythrobacter sp. CAU 1778]
MTLQGAGLSLQEGAAFCSLLAEAGGDIFLRCDPRGFVQHAAGGTDQIGLRLDARLIGPKLAELAVPTHVERLERHVSGVLSGQLRGAWTEVQLRTVEGTASWYVLQLRPLHDGARNLVGAIAALRCVDRERRLRDRLFQAAVTDQLTGFANRRAFIAMLNHLARRDEGGAVALIRLNGLSAINLRFGASAGDRLLGAVAGFLRERVTRSHIVGRTGGETFGLILPDGCVDEALRVAERIVGDLTKAARVQRQDASGITANAGVGAIAVSADESLRQAELGLVAANARGPGVATPAHRRVKQLAMRG